MLSTFRPIWRLAAARVRALAALGAAACAAERVVVFLAAVALAHADQLRAFFVVGALGVIFGVRTFVRAAIARRARNEIIAGAARALLGGDVLQGSALPAQDVEAAILDGLFQGERLLSDALPAVVGDALASLGLAVALMFMVPVRFLVIGLVALPIASAVIAVARSVTVRALERAQNAYVPVVDAIVAAHAGRLEIVASGRTLEFLADLRASTEAWSVVAMRAEGVSALAGRAPVLAGALSVAAVVLLQQGIDGPLTTDTLGAAIVFASVVPAFAGFSRNALEIARAGPKLRPLVTLLQSTQSRIGEGHRVPEQPAALAWQGVSFAYGDGPSVLEGLNAACSSPGALVFVGPNGSGKSTALRLLLGLAEARSGTLTVGGIDLFDLDLVAWRRCTAYLPQRAYLPERATVREAIRLIARDADDRAIRRSLERLSVSVPLDTRVAELSTGQRQRVALARALVLDAPVLILDEPDANLDHDGIELVASLVSELAKTRTVVVAAHTSRLIAAATHVVELEPPKPG